MIIIIEPARITFFRWTPANWLTARSLNHLLASSPDDLRRATGDRLSSGRSHQDAEGGPQSGFARGAG
jgi:hypothetical protein